MAEQIGKNAVKLASEGGSKEQLIARIAEAESKGLEGLFNAPQAPDGPSVAVEHRAPLDAAPMQVTAPPPSLPKIVETKPDSLQKFKDSEGKIDLDKVEKSNEHLKRGIESREEQLLRLNRELQKKFTQTGQELSAKRQELPDDASLDFSEEGKKKIIEELDKDIVGSIVKIVRTAVKKETAPILNDVSSIKERTRESTELKELDDLVKDGNDWILQEGLGRFEAIFQERPYLRQSRTPFRDALRFMEFPRLESQPAQVRAGAQTPILGASQTVPPPSTLPPSTPEQDIENLSAQLREAIAYKNLSKAKEIEAQLDRVYRGMYRR